MQGALIRGAADELPREEKTGIVVHLSEWAGRFEKRGDKSSTSSSIDGQSHTKYRAGPDGSAGKNRSEGGMHYWSF